MAIHGMVFLRLLYFMCWNSETVHLWVVTVRHFRDFTVYMSIFLDTSLKKPFIIAGFTRSKRTFMLIYYTNRNRAKIKPQSKDSVSLLSYTVILLPHFELHRAPPSLHYVPPQAWDVDISNVVFPVDALDVKPEGSLLFFGHALHQPLGVAVIEPAM